MNIKTVLIIGGLVLIAVSLLADQIGLGDGDGIGFKQTSGAVAGGAALLFGIFKKK